MSVLRRVFALLAASLLAAGLLSPGVVQASGYDGSEIVIYECGKDQYGLLPCDHLGMYKVDTGSVSNLALWSTGLTLGCDGFYDNWNNCITTVRTILKAGSCVTFYDSTGYSGYLITWYAQGSDVDSYRYMAGGSLDNRATSIRWGDWKYSGTTGHYSCVFGPYD